MSSKNAIRAAGLVLVAFTVGGCATHTTPSTFNRSEVGRAQSVEWGVVQNVRAVTIQNDQRTVGTATGAVQLLQKLGAEVVAACFVIDLPDLGGARKIEALGVPVRTLVSFEGH